MSDDSPLTLEHFYLALGSLAVAMVLGLCCFVAEKLVGRGTGREKKVEMYPMRRRKDRARLCTVL